MRNNGQYTNDGYTQYETGANRGSFVKAKIVLVSCVNPAPKPAPNNVQTVGISVPITLPTIVPSQQQYSGGPEGYDDYSQNNDVYQQ